MALSRPIAQLPKDATTNHDLDPNADGDLVRTVLVANTQAFVVAVESVDSEPMSVSVEWVYKDENTAASFGSESATDIELSGVTEDWARLIRKGPYARVTVTSDAADGTQNRANVWLDSHR